MAVILDIRAISALCRVRESQQGSNQPDDRAKRLRYVDKRGRVIGITG